MLVVVLPSPAGVGVIAETRMSFDWPFFGGAVEHRGVDFCNVLPVRLPLGSVES